MNGLQQLVPNANKVLRMSRLGGRPPLPPLLAGLASEGGGSGGPSSNGAQEGGPVSDSMAITEQQVVKLMEEDMGSAMQYLQGKGLCLMPISLATAISTTTSHQPPTSTVLPPNLVNDGSVKDSTPNSKA